MANNKTMTTILKASVTILLTSLLGLISVMYWDMRHDVASLKVSQDETAEKLDSLIITQITNTKFVAFVDSVQTVEIRRGFEDIRKQIKELSR